MKQKLIDQLIHRAGARFGGDGINYDGFVPSKFAELIVRECAEVIFETPVKYTEIDIMHIIRDRVREHFGVEP